MVHPVKDCPKEIDVFEYNIAFISRLKPYCNKYNIIIAIENMFIEDKKRGHIVSSVCGIRKEHAALYDKLGSEHFTACLDLGHSGLAGNEADIGYDGDFTFEIDNCLGRFPVEFMPEVLRFLCALGRNMTKRIEEMGGKS